MDSDEETPQQQQQSEEKSGTLEEQLFGSDSDNDDDEPQPQTQAQPQTQVSQSAEDDTNEAASSSAAAAAEDTMKDLFGSDDDEAADAQATEGQQAILSDSEEETYRPQTVQATHSKLCVPAFPKPNPSATLCMLKVPHFLGVSMEEYNRNSYNAEVDKLKFPKAATVMRWRYKADGNGQLVLGDDGRPIRESNARLVRWSDGTTQLMVGDDLYNVALSDIKTRHSHLYATLRSDAPRIAEDAGLDPQLDLGRSKENGEHEWYNKTDVEMRSILECHGQITHDAKIVPTGLQSEQHKRLVMQVRKHAHKGKKVREMAKVTMAPEKQSALSAEARKMTIKRQRREQTLARRGRPAMNISYLEEGMDDDTSLARIKAGARGRYASHLDDTGEDLKDFIVDEEDDDDEGDYEDDDDDDSGQDEDDGHDVADDDDEGEFDDEEDDDEEEVERPKAKSKEAKRKPEAESSSVAESSGQAKRRKRIVDDDEDED